MIEAHNVLLGKQRAPAGLERELPGIKSCFSSLGCPELGLDEMITLAATNGIECLELRFLEEESDLPSLLASKSGGWKAAADLLAGRHMEVRVLGTSLKLSENSEKDRLQVVEFARLAEVLGVPYLRVFGGGTWPVPLDENGWDRAVDTCRWWNKRRLLEGWNCEMLLETHDSFSSSPPCLELMNRLGASVPLIWDAHHTWRLGGETPAQSWKMLHEHVRHVHIKDSVDIPSARHSFTYVLPGEGEMPLKSFWKVVEEGGYRGAVSLEWEKKWHSYLPPLSKALEACRLGGWW